MGFYRALCHGRREVSIRDGVEIADAGFRRPVVLAASARPANYVPAVRMKTR